MERDAAQSLIVKLREFARCLDEPERALLATLLAPGIAQAFDGDDEVRGFEIGERLVRPLPEALVAALRDSSIRIVGLDDQ